MAVITGLIAAALLYAAVILRARFFPYQGLFGFGFAAALVIAAKLIWVAVIGLLFSLTYFFSPNNSGKISLSAGLFGLLFILIDLWFFISSLFDSQQLTKKDFLSNSIDLIAASVIFAIIFATVKFIKARFF